jgi:adenylate kinase family enzyme
MFTFRLPERVAVIGTSCSGKSTLAAALAAELDAPHIELDAHYWGPNWTPIDGAQFRQRIDEQTSQPRWVCDGNYSVIRDLVWRRADTIVWLNYSFPVVFGRALRRTISRCITRSTIFSGNRESFRMSFLSRDSILLWVVRTHHAHQREYPKRFNIHLVPASDTLCCCPLCGFATINRLKTPGLDRYELERNRNSTGEHPGTRC